MALASARATRELICPGCGRLRLVSSRTARRVPKTCNLCRHPSQYRPPTDSDRRFWLKSFTDREIVDLAFAIFDEIVDAENVHSWRERLCPEDHEILMHV